MLGTFALVGIEPVSARTVKPKYFLQKALPLNLVVTTPVELSNSDSASVGLYGRQALTVRALFLTCSENLKLGFYTRMASEAHAMGLPGSWCGCRPSHPTLLTPPPVLNALQAVFSRPVIALGSDFGTPASEQKVSFQRDVGSCMVCRALCLVGAS